MRLPAERRCRPAATATRDFFRVGVMFSLLCSLLAVAAPAAEPQVRCPDCNKRGRMSCPDCDGRGHLERDCTICSGRGEAACPVCTKKTNEAGKGLLRCHRCRGDGTIEATGKSCSRCAGQGSTTCLTCRGKTVRPCVPRVYDKRCPTCRSARRIQCRTCGGDQRVTAAVREHRLRAKSTAAMAPPALKPKRETSKAHATTSVQPATSADATPRPPPTEELQQRHDAVSAVYEHHFELFAVDPRPDFKRMEKTALTLRKEAQRLGRSVPTADETRHMDVVAMLKNHYERVQSFSRRWNQLRDLFDVELRTYRTLTETWKQRQETLASTPTVHLEKETERLNRRADLALRLVEQKAKPLIDENPTWLGEEAAALEKVWPTLKADSEKHLAALKKAVREQELEAQTMAAERKQLAERNKIAERKALSRRNSRRSRSSSRRSDEIVAGATPRALEATKPKTPMQTTEAAPSQAKSPDPDGSWTSSPLLWALGGFLGAAGLFVVMSRRRVVAPDDRSIGPRERHRRPASARAFHQAFEDDDATDLLRTE